MQPRAPARQMVVRLILCPCFEGARSREPAIQWTSYIKIQHMLAHTCLWALQNTTWVATKHEPPCSLPGGSGQCNSCNALLHCLGAVGSGTRAFHRLTAWGPWAVQLLQCTVSLPDGGVSVQTTYTEFMIPR